MKKILILNCGGTFHKTYNELKGELEINNNCETLKSILTQTVRGNLNFDIKGIIYKDSLDFTTQDREEVVSFIKDYEKILIIHGTDTMDITASFIAKRVKNKTVILTGAMIPYSINPIEATANLSMSLYFLTTTVDKGVFIGMHGLVKEHNKIYKNKDLGIFLCQK